MSGNKEAILVPIEALKRLRDVLNQIARASPNLDAETAKALNESRRELFALFPSFGKTPMRSTDGPGYDEAYKRGFRFGANAVMTNFEECVQVDLQDNDALMFLADWVRSRRKTALSSALDGSDPEYVELVRAFDLGTQQGIDRFLAFVRDDYEPDSAEAAMELEY